MLYNISSTPANQPLSALKQMQTLNASKKVVKIALLIVGIITLIGVTIAAFCCGNPPLLQNLVRIDLCLGITTACLAINYFSLRRSYQNAKELCIKSNNSAALASVDNPKQFASLLEMMSAKNLKSMLQRDDLHTEPTLIEQLAQRPQLIYEHLGLISKETIRALIHVNGEAIQHYCQERINQLIDQPYNCSSHLRNVLIEEWGIENNRISIDIQDIIKKPLTNLNLICLDLHKLGDTIRDVETREEEFW
jgi:hypothetical protein